MANTMKVVVKPGQTVVRGVKTSSGIRKERHGPGKEIELPAAEAERLIDRKAVARVGTEEAHGAREAADRLPSGFPGLDALQAEGIETYSALAGVAKERELTDLKGIGEKTAETILEKLAEREAE